jgi:hypothetical protein
MEPHGLSWDLMQTSTCYSDSGASAYLKQSFFAESNGGGKELSYIYNAKVPVHKIQFYFNMSVVEFINNSFVLWMQIQRGYSCSGDDADTTIYYPSGAKAVF